MPDPSAAILTEYIFLNVADLHESPTNPRKTFDQKRLEELAESVGKVGITHPLLARPREKGGYEIVAGHRRARAAALAGMRQVPAFVRNLTDLEVVETQLIELAQRDDVHPLEEADTYLVMKRDHSLPEAEIAAKVGKTPAYVHQRLKLCSLVEPARSAYLKGTLSGAVAQLLARIGNPKLQAQASEEVLEGGESDLINGAWKRLPMNLYKAAEHLRDKYTLGLAGAPFDTKDAELVPAAGSCLACPKRTGNQVELFPDVKSKDVCTDPTCFAAKKAAAYAKTKAAAKAEGAKVLSKSEGEKLFSGWGDKGLPRDAPYVDLKAKCEEDPKRRTWRQLLGKHVPEVVKAPDRDSKFHDLVDKKAAVAALKAAGHKFAEKVTTTSREDSGSYRAQQERDEAAQKAKARKLAAVADRALEVMVDEIVSGNAMRRALVLMVEQQAGEGYGDDHFIYRRLKLDRDVEVTDKHHKQFSDLVAGMPEPELLGMLFEILIGDTFYSTWNDRLTPMAKEWDLDLKQIRKEAEAAEKTSAAKKPAAGAAKPDEDLGDGDLFDSEGEEVPCVGCGCTDSQGCPEGCSWLEGATVDSKKAVVCSSCAGITDQAKKGTSKPAKASKPEKKAKPAKKAASSHAGRAACLVPNCGRPGVAKGLCATHYRKARRLKLGDTFSQAQLDELAEDSRRAKPGKAVA